MTAVLSQPIAGVSANRETDIEAVYPSVASNAVGRMVGGVMGAVQSAIPVTVVRIIALILVGSVMAPFALLAYAWRLCGTCFVITNRSVQERRIIGQNQVRQVALSDIDNAEITIQGGYDFHRVGDVNLLNAKGNVLLSIPAISFPERLRQIILDAREARVQSDETLERIQARG